MSRVRSGWWRRWATLLSALLVAGVVGACGDDRPMAEVSMDAGAAPVNCDYPRFSGDLALGETLPSFVWNGAIQADGSAFNFSVADFFCSPEYDRYSSLILVVSAGWCGACPSYIKMMNSISANLDALGSLVVYVEVETSSFEPATSAEAAEFIDSSCAPDEFEEGLRIGDGDNPDYDNRLRQKVSRFPSGYFIRRSDMTIVADQAASIYTLQYEDLAANPEQDWTPVLPPFMGNCGEDSEEAEEPNDSLSEAALIEPGEIEGGICSEGSDFYQVNLEGAWRFSLYQNLFMGEGDPRSRDLNLRLWSTTGERLGGSNVRGNHDWVDYEGPAFVEVYGEQNASDTYRVVLSERTEG